MLRLRLHQTSGSRGGGGAGELTLAYVYYFFWTSKTDNVYASCRSLLKVDGLKCVAGDCCQWGNKINF